MKLIAIIPARAGSKGVPGKNLRIVSGKPLVAHAIEAARDSQRFEAIYVSSDSSDVLSLAEMFGARGLPRPAELASDTAAMADVIKDVHSLLLRNRQPAGDAFALLQPTSPLRTSRHVRDCVDRFGAGDFRSAVSICAVNSTPQKSLVLREGVIEPLFGWDALHANRQSFDQTYRQNGAIWVTRWDAFHRSGCFVVPPAMPYLMDEAESIDIDSESDLAAAEAAFVRVRSSGVIGSS
jgi:CMP-N-acetylneuraminic acid synthetase